MHDDATLSSMAAAFYAQKEYAKAFDIYRQLARKNYPDCQIFVGWMCHMGIGTSKNDDDALRWFEEAATLGVREAMYYCGKLLTTKGNHLESLPWYEKAAENGYPPAMYHLGVMYDNGMGVLKNRSIAMKYFKEGARNGHIFSKRAIALRYMAGRGGIITKIKGLMLYLQVIVSAIRIGSKNLYSDDLKW